MNIFSYGSYHDSYYLLPMILLFLLWGCQLENTSDNSSENGQNNNTIVVSAPPETNRPQLILTSTSLKQSAQIEIDYTRAINTDYGPRVAELFLEYSDNLQYLASEKGDALTKADKQLVLQKLGDQGLVRIVILAADNTKELETGRLVTLTFKKTNDKEATVRILTDSPIFAPEAANEGLLVSDPITF